MAMKNPRLADIERLAAALGADLDVNSPKDLAAYAPTGKVFVDSDCHTIVVSADGEPETPPSAVRRGMYDALLAGLRDCDDPVCDYCHDEA